MKTKRWMRYLAMAMALALVMATPLQASEYVTEDTTEAVPVVASEDEAAEEELSSEEDIMVEETDLAEAVSAEGAAPAAEISEDGPTVEVTDIAEMDSFDSKGTTIGTTTSATLWTGVWLHVVHGNFSGDYPVEKDHNEGEEDISKMSSIWVRKEKNWFLPALTNLKVTRSNGEFDGWYTEAPTEELQSKGDYSVWHTVKTNGKRIKPGDVIPEGVRVLYAAFKDKDKEKVQDSDKLVTFYLDWNGINGRFGHCLTCIRGYKDGKRPEFTAEDAAVYNLNFETDNPDQFSELTWENLKAHWAKKTFNGYTFKGWATTPDATDEDLIWKDTEIENGASFYAVWTKGDESNITFERVDPEAGPLKAIRIMAGNGTTFTSGTLSAGKHGLKGASFTLNLFRVPVRAEENEITWTLEVTEGLKEGGTLADVFKPKKGSIEVKGGTTSSAVFYTVDDKTSGDGDETNNVKKVNALEVTAKGDTLTVTNLDGKARSIVVSASAPGVDEKKNPITVTSPASATLCFSHSWKVTSQGQPGCTKCGTIHYTCTECKAEEIETTPALGHFYKTGVENEPGQEYYEVVKLPTCTTAGTKQYICQRCGETSGGTASIPATGHCWGEWKVTKEPTVSETGVKTRSCEHCEEQETEILPQLVAAPQDSQPGNDEADEDDPADNSAPTPEVKPEDNTQNGTTENEAKTDDPVQDDDEQTGKDTVNPVPTVSTPTSYATNSVVKTVSAGKSAAKTGWQKVGKKKCYYVNGVKQTGWKKIGKKKYYFGKNGVMQTGWKTIGKKKYYFGKNGVMRTGKQKIGKKIYVFGKNGALKK